MVFQLEKEAANMQARAVAALRTSRTFVQFPFQIP